MGRLVIIRLWSVATEADLTRRRLDAAIAAA
jgi:hypothetical protein